MVYGDTDLIDKYGNPIGRFNARQRAIKELMRGGVNIPQPAAFWRRELWDLAGPLDPAYILRWIMISGSGLPNMAKSIITPNSGPVSDCMTRAKQPFLIIVAGRRCARFINGKGVARYLYSWENMYSENYWDLPGIG